MIYNVSALCFEKNSNSGHGPPPKKPCFLYWHKLLEKHHEVATVFFDVKKAFDSWPHSQILSSLQTLGIHGPLLHEIKDYLSNRQQRVVLDGTMSDPVTVTSDVPQGSILGPLLFNIFMNSITMPNSYYMQMTFLFTSQYTIQLGARNFKKMLSWMQFYGLTANHSKTNLLSITCSWRTILVNISVNNHLIFPCDSVKYFGVTINHDL